MATLASDNFNRANGGLGANYTIVPGKAALTIVSNAVELTSTAADGGDIYTGISWPNDQWSQVTLNVMNYADNAIDVVVRCSNSVATWYVAYIGGPFGSSATYAIARVVTGTRTFIQTITTHTFSANDVIRLAVQSTTLTLYQNGAQIWTGTDANISSGYPGFILGSNAETVSDTIMGPWAGGNFAAAGTLLLTS